VPATPSVGSIPVSRKTRRRIAEFWDWWGQHSGAIAGAISAGTIASWVPGITQVVHAIDPGLAWELMPGRHARHALVVTAEGKTELIGTTEEWLKGGPPVDATWEFDSARPPAPLESLTVSGLTFDLARVRSRWTRDTRLQKLDIDLWHPAWTAASPAARWLSAQLFLDRLLGERDKQRWIASVNIVESASDGADAASLGTAVEDLVRAASRKNESWRN
jgi:hypothetical protein